MTYLGTLWLLTRGGRTPYDVFNGQIMLGDGRGGFFHQNVPSDAEISLHVNSGGYAQHKVDFPSQL